MAKFTTAEALEIGFVCFVLGLISILAWYPVFGFLFVAIVVAVIWDSQREMSELKARVAKLESGQKSDGDKPSSSS